MKCRKLKAILNTGYIVHDGGKTLNIGSAMCSELITMDKEAKCLAYALGWPDKSRPPERDREGGPRPAWDGLERLIASGEIDEFLSGNDEFENPVSVFWQDRGEIFESVTDEIGWPRTTAEGRLMHDNTDFATRAEAVKDAIHWAWYRMDQGLDREQELLKSLEEVRARIADAEEKRAILEKEMPGEFDRFAKVQDERKARYG
jgi:hypothetical protein